MMKKIAFLAFLAGLLLVVAQPAAATSLDNCCKVDCQKLNKNPKIVACYESGTHGIVGQSETHTGVDYVKQLSCGNLFQFFCGSSPSEGLHREISLWKFARDQRCPTGWILLENPYPEWGDYLKPEANYCVKTITLPCPKNGCLSSCPTLPKTE
ncbi:MAG TPA: hypothetical protein VMW04_04055 [Patescibacteria group bacterium]|nr:hypothetical protein [Patescibacteria group bacterium]